MADKKNKLDITDVNKMLADRSGKQRRKEIARRQLMTWKVEITAEEKERLLQHETFVRTVLKEYMCKELAEIRQLLDRIDREKDRKKKREKTDLLLDDLRRLLPDLTEILN